MVSKLVQRMHEQGKLAEASAATVSEETAEASLMSDYLIGSAAEIASRRGWTCDWKYHSPYGWGWYVCGTHGHPYCPLGHSRYFVGDDPYTPLIVADTWRVAFTPNTETARHKVV